MIHNPQYLMKEFVGIELLQPIKHGHDGIINGYQYFDAPMGHGICIPIHHVIRKIQTTELFKKLQDITCCYLKTVRKTEANRIPPYINYKSIDSVESEYVFKHRRTTITAVSIPSPDRKSSINTNHLNASRKVSTITESETKTEHKLIVDVDDSEDDSQLHALSPSVTLSTNVCHQKSIDSMLVNRGNSIDPAKASVLRYNPPPQLQRQNVGANMHLMVQSDSTPLVDGEDALVRSIVHRKGFPYAYKQRERESKKVII
eukprot:26047_1